MHMYVHAWILHHSVPYPHIRTHLVSEFVVGEDHCGLSPLHLLFLYWLCSSFFSSARLSLYVGFILYFVVFVPYFFLFARIDEIPL